jgi:hypothetical protein
MKLKSGVYYIKLFSSSLECLSTSGLYYKHISIADNDPNTTIWNFTLGAYLMTLATFKVQATVNTIVNYDCNLFIV